jgi:hypothetical protein
MGKKIIILAALVLGLVSPALAADPDPNLVGWWEFDGDALDASGNGRNGSLQGNAHFDTGIFDQALVLGGSPDYVNVDGYKGVQGGHPFSICAWVKTTATGDNTIVSWGTTTGRQKVDFRLYQGRLRVEHGSGNLQGNTVLADDMWHHVALTVEENAPIQQPQVTLYLDGQNDSQATTSTSTFDIQVGSDVAIGRRAMNSDRYFPGLVDDVRVYDRVLSPEEVVVLAKRPRSWSPSPADGDLVEAAFVDLQWLPGGFAAQHAVYVGTSPELGAADLVATQAETTFALTDLVQEQTYYWRIDDVEADGTVHPGAVWSFWVSPMRAYHPQPEDATVNVLTNAQLSWTGGWSPLMHTVYFGMNKDEVAAAAGGLPQMDATYDPGLLALDTTYYWRVDEFYAGQWVAGPVWSFKTVAPVPPIEDPNLVAWYTLDEGIGRTAIDWSGHDGHGTLIGDVQWAAGVQGGALSFNRSTSDYVEAPEAPNVTGTHSRTATAWIKTATYGEIVSWGQNVAGQKWIFRVQESNGTLGAIRVEVNGGYQVGSTDVRDEEWHHVAAVLVDDGSPDANEISLYVDGLLEANSAQLDEPINTAAGVVRIGLSPWHNRPFNGLIDDVRIYDKVLTGEEIGRMFGAVSAALPLATVSPATSVESTGDDGMVLSIDGVVVTDLVLGVTSTDFEKYADHPAPHADDFDLKTYASLDDSKFITTTFAVPVRTVFIIERGANDLGSIQLLDAAGNPVGAAQPFATTDWFKPGVKINGQDAGAMVITSRIPISAVMFLPPADAPMGLDPASVSAIPAP